MTSRVVTLASKQTDELYRRFVEDLERRIDDPSIDNNDLCRDILMEIYHGPGADYAGMMADASIPLSLKTSIACLDPRNITLESEYYSEVDPTRFYRNK